MVDGHDIRDLGIQWLRSQIGLVSQEPVLFDFSIRENIQYGDNGRQVTMDEVITAARMANIHTFVDSLPLVSLVFRPGSTGNVDSACLRIIWLYFAR